jgi:hypothetical protein
MLPNFATVIARHSLVLPEVDHPTTRHVRAASGLAWFGGRLGLVQDDTTAIIWLNQLGQVVEEQSLEANQALPQHFDAALGNKHLKPDLETIVSFVWQQSNYWLALGSGSSNQRNRAVLLADQQQRHFVPHQPIWLDLQTWYDTLRDCQEFSGIGLNIEAAFASPQAAPSAVGQVMNHQHLYLLQRGNGRSSDAVNAIAQFDLADVGRYLSDPKHQQPPTLLHVQRCKLGSTMGVPWGFADACTIGQRQYVLLNAEDSIDAIQDGAVVGTALAFCDHAQFDALQIGNIVDAQGLPIRIKLEGLSALDAETLIAVSDEDDPARPSECLILRLAAC